MSIFTNITFKSIKRLFKEEQSLWQNGIKSHIIAKYLVLKLHTE